MKKEFQLHIRIDEESKWLLETAAFSLRMTKSSVVRQALKALVEKEMGRNAVLSRLMSSEEKCIASPPV